MIVFKTILKILNKIKGMLIIYTVMLLSITLINQTGNNQTNFEETKPSIAIINKDSNNYLTDNFISYLNDHTKIKTIEEDKLDDALFYRDISYIIYIPNNYTNANMILDNLYIFPLHNLKAVLKSNND